MAFYFVGTDCQLLTNANESIENGRRRAWAFSNTGRATGRSNVAVNSIGGRLLTPATLSSEEKLSYVFAFRVKPCRIKHS